MGEYPVVALDTLLDVTSASVTSEGFGYDPEGGELWFVGETAEAVLLELHGRRSALRAETGLEALLSDATGIAGETAERARIAEEAYGHAPRLRAATLDPQIHARLVELTHGSEMIGAPGRPPRGSRRRCGPGSTPERPERASSARSCVRSAPPR